MTARLGTCAGPGRQETTQPVLREVSGAPEGGLSWPRNGSLFLGSLWIFTPVEDVTERAKGAVVQPSVMNRPALGLTLLEWLVAP